MSRWSNNIKFKKHHCFVLVHLYPLPFNLRVFGYLYLTILSGQHMVNWSLVRQVRAGLAWELKISLWYSVFSNWHTAYIFKCTHALLSTLQLVCIYFPGLKYRLPEFPPEVFSLSMREVLCLQQEHMVIKLQGILDFRIWSKNENKYEWINFNNIRSMKFLTSMEYLKEFLQVRQLFVN